MGSPGDKDNVGYPSENLQPQELCLNTKDSSAQEQHVLTLESPASSKEVVIDRKYTPAQEQHGSTLESPSSPSFPIMEPATQIKHVDPLNEEQSLLESPSTPQGLCNTSPSRTVAPGSVDLELEDRPVGERSAEPLGSLSRLFGWSPIGEDLESLYHEGYPEQLSVSPPHPDLSSEMDSFLPFNQDRPLLGKESPSGPMKMKDPLLQYGSHSPIVPVPLSGLVTLDSSPQQGCQRIATPLHLLISALPTEEFIDSITMEYVPKYDCFPFRKTRMHNRGPHTEASRAYRLCLSILNDVSPEGKKELGKKESKKSSPAKGSTSGPKKEESKEAGKSAPTKKKEDITPGTASIQKGKKRKGKSLSPKKLDFSTEKSSSATKKRKTSSSKIAAEPVKKEEDSTSKSNKIKKKAKTSAQHVDASIKEEEAHPDAEEESTSKSAKPKKKAKTRAQLVEESIQEEEEAHPNAEQDKSSDLFDFLYANSTNDELEDSMVEDFDDFFKMFNPDIDIDELVAQGIEYLEPMWEDYLNLVEDEAISIKGTQFVHPTSIGNKNSSTRRAIARRIHLMPPAYTFVTEECPFHKGSCRVVDKLAAFICYLSSLANSEEEKVLEEQFKFERTTTLKEEEDDEDSEGEGKELTAEEKKAIRYGSIKELQPVDEDALEDSDIPVPALPTFKILEKEYVLLHDIQVLFNLREDYCLALIAQQMHEEQDWVLQDPTLEKVNTCFDPNMALEACFEEAKKHEGEIPSEAEFLDTQHLIGDPRRQQLLLETNLKDSEDTPVKTENPIIEEPEDVAGPSTKRGEKFIKLWKDGLLEADEQNQVSSCIQNDTI